MIFLTHCAAKIYRLKGRWRHENSRQGRSEKKQPADLSEKEDGCTDSKLFYLYTTSLDVIENVYGWEECGKRWRTLSIIWTGLRKWGWWKSEIISTSWRKYGWLHLCSIFPGLRCRSAADCESWRWTSPAAQVDDVNDPMKCQKVQKDQVCKRRRCELFSAHDETKPFGEDKSGGWNYVSGTKECFTAVYGQAGGCFIPDMKYTETGGNSSPKKSDIKREFGFAKGFRKQGFQIITRSNPKKLTCTLRYLETLLDILWYLEVLPCISKIL